MDLRTIRRAGVAVLLVIFSGLALYRAYTRGAEKESQQPPREAIRAGIANLPRKPDVERHEGLFPRDSNLQDVLLKFDFTPQQIHDLIQDSKSVYNLNRVMAGHRYALEQLESGAFRSLKYQISDDEYLMITRGDGHFRASRHRYPFRIEEKELAADIQDSMWATLIDLGEDDQLVMELANLLQWDVDFTLIQPHDSVRMIVQKKYLNGRFVKYGDILAAEFTSGGHSFYAFRFEDREGGSAHYYDQKGKAVRKAFLRVPFRFNPRISSGFSYSRFHPILKVRRPHLGIDYAAPRGTPVLASASGTVIFAGRRGGYGRQVRIRHPNGYVTDYAHLSRIRVHFGQKVAQGKVIGNVGSSGLATGPHLDYRVQDSRGRFLNPRKKLSWPSDKPVPKSKWKDFTALRDSLMQRLSHISESNPLAKSVRAAE